MAFPADDRKTYSLGRLGELGKRLGPVESLLTDHRLCIYATGSYGRLEAWEGSDIDLFFLYEPERKDDRFPTLTFIRLASCLIEATEDMGFPAFSGDGRWLEVHDVTKMEEVLGSPEDDSLNAFTARMLLLLESQPVYGPSLYADLLQRVIGFYYRDYEGHEADFLPVFLCNDILRFWRTLTLNYEHDRFEVSRLPDNERPEARAKSALKNYKLKVSRLATCFSMVVHLAAEEPPVTAERVLALCRTTPYERFQQLRGRGADELVDAILDQYERFLEIVQRPTPDVLDDFRKTGSAGDGPPRAELLGAAREFGNTIFALLQAVAKPERIRPLIV